MALFIIRVELHNASRQDYFDLANDLASKGITDVITADNGNRLKMPPAEYNYSGTEGIEVVLNAAKASANKTGRSSAVFVSEASRWLSSGLEVVQARRSA